MSKLRPSEVDNNFLALVLDEHIDTQQVNLHPKIVSIAREAAFRLRKCPIPFSVMYEHEAD